MQLLYVIPEYPPYSQGGIATFYRHLLPEIARQGHDVQVLVANAFMEPFLPYAKDGVRVDCLDWDCFTEMLPRYEQYAAAPYLQRYLATAWAAWEQAQTYTNVDLVETTDWGLLFAPWAIAAQRPPCLVQCHASIGQIDSYDPQQGTELQGHLIRFIESNGLGALDGIQTYSALNQRTWEKLLRCPVEHIPPAFQLPTLPTSASQGVEEATSIAAAQPPVLDPVPVSLSGQAKENVPTAIELDRQAIPSHSPLANPQLQGLVVGRIQRWKGPQVLCEALEHLGDRAPLIHWIGRDTPYRDSKQTMGDYLQAQYPQLWGETLRPLGPRPPATVAQLQAQADFVLVPSTWDVFNLSCVEAMAQGKVVICSQGAGAAELIHSGYNGFCFPPGDSVALASCIEQCQQLTPEEREAMGQAARQTIQQRLHPEAIAQRRLSAYGTIIAQPQSAAASPWLAHAVSPGQPAENPQAFLDYLPLRSLLSYCGQRLLKKRWVA